MHGSLKSFCSGLKSNLIGKLTPKECSLRKAENGRLPGFEKETTWNGPFYFIHAADTQLGLLDRIGMKSDIYIKKEMKTISNSINVINAMTPRPKFVVMCGDQIDAFPGSKLRETQTKAFFSVFRELHPDIPLICVCGNHDVGDRPTPEAIEDYKKTYGDDYYSFVCDGVMFIVINSQYYMDSTKTYELFKKQEMWLDGQLEEAKSGKYKHVIVFQHIPWFYYDVEEFGSFASLPPSIRGKMLPKFYDANVRAIFCGHLHRNAEAFYKDLEVVITTAVGSQTKQHKPGFRVVLVGDDFIKHKYYAIEDAPKYIPLDGINLP